MYRGFRSWLFLAGVSLVVLAVVPRAGLAQESGAEAAGAEPEHLAPPVLDQMLAPIALYPDALLSQVLMASTYPLEVIEAHRWVNDPANAGLQGAALEQALETQTWDPSVKSLVAFPDVLKVMNDKLAWMQQLGNAFLAHPEDVMDSVQRLRSQAAAAGNLKSGDQQRVVTEQQTIVIQPASTRVVYVPVYDPFVVYGPWRYPAYPPYFFAPFPRYGIQVGVFSWFSFGVISLYWGWNSFDWHHHRIHIDRDRYHRIRHDHDPYPHDYWQHDPRHRRGVAYVDPRVGARFRPNPAGTPASRADFRGYAPDARPDQPVPRRTTTSATYKPQQPAAPEPVKPKAPDVKPRDARAPDATSPDVKPRDVTPRDVKPGDVKPRDVTPRDVKPGDVKPRDVTPRDVKPGDVKPRDVTPREPPRTPGATFTPPARPDRAGVTPRVPPAFEGYTSGDRVRDAVTRARDSRRSTAVPTPRTSSPPSNRTERSRPSPDSKRPR